MSKVRASMLPSYSDCARRAAASQFSKEVVDAGYNLNESRSGIYNIVGQSVHLSANYMLREKIKTGGLPSVERSINTAMEEYKHQFKKENDVIFDDVTVNKNHAEKQIIQMTKYFYTTYAPMIQMPTGVNPDEYLECELKAEIYNFEISGHVDIISESNIIDIKTGSTVKPYYTQLGCYGNLAVNNGYNMPENLIVLFLPRVHPDKKYPGTKHVIYNTSVCMKEAFSLTKKVIRDYKEFMKSGNCGAFPANPQSTLCNKKYCRAFGTKFCEFYGEG